MNETSIKIDKLLKICTDISGGVMPTGLATAIAETLEVSREYVRQRAVALDLITARAGGTTQRYCVQCGTPVERYQKFCSLEHKRDWYKKLYWTEKNCEVCGKPVSILKSRLARTMQQYCSYSCSSKMKNSIYKGRPLTYTREYVLEKIGDKPFMLEDAMKAFGVERKTASLRLLSLRNKNEVQVFGKLGRGKLIYRVTPEKS